MIRTLAAHTRDPSSIIHFPLFRVIKPNMGVFIAEVSMNSVTGVKIAFVGSPEQSSRSLIGQITQTLHYSTFE